MADTFILIPGRSSRQGVTLNEGKYTDGYKEEINTLRMHPDDMQRPMGVAINRRTRRGKLIFSGPPVLLPSECFVPLDQIEPDIH